MRVIVVGGGVAGTVSAIALRRLGAEVTVFEAYQDPGGEVGSFLSLAANGLRGLAAIDCLDRVRDRGFPVARQRMWARSGKLLGDVPRGRLSGDPLHSVTLMRSQLVGELRAAAEEAGARIITGEQFAHATAVHDGVCARFTGGDTVTADLLVGADGIWSATRRTLDPHAPNPRYAGIHVVSGRSDGIDVDEGVFNMVFARNGAFIYIREPGGDLWWQAQVNSTTEPVIDGVDDAEWLRRLGTLYQAERLPSAIVAATTRLHRPTVNHVLDPVPIWHDRQTVLVGDAAHPVGAGQGASMAIEDGLVLAAALGAAPSISAGLAEYERLRRPRITRMQKAAEDNREIKKAGAIKRTVEELFMPMVFRHFYEKATAWLYTYQPQTPAPSSQQPTA